MLVYVDKLPILAMVAGNSREPGTSETLKDRDSFIFRKGLDYDRISF